MMNIDLLLVGIFLIVLFVSGLYYGRGVKTFEDYALGNRKLSTFVLTVSLIATTYGGNILNTRIDGLYRQGFYLYIMDLASPINYYLIARFVLVRMKEFMGHCSIAESMGSLYGQEVRMLTAFLGILFSMALIAAQFKVGFHITTLLFPEMENFSTLSAILLALLVILYSSFGGARAVALTDVFQFFLFGVCLPVLIFTLLYFAKDPLAGWQKMTNMPQFNPKQVLCWNNALSGSLAYLLWRSVFPFDPARIQRFYMSSSIQQATTVFKRSAVIRVVLPTLFLLVAIALHVGGHTIPTTQNALDYLTKLTCFPGLRGILVAAIIALLMSTADSSLHAASILFGNDVWAVAKQWAKKNHKPSLKTMRIASVLIGLASLLLVIHTTDVLQLLNKTVHFYGPSVTVPLILASFGFRPRPAAVLWTMIANTIMASYHILYEGNSVTQKDVFLSLLFGAFVLFLMHYSLPKEYPQGWIGIKDRNPIDLQAQETKRWWVANWQQIRKMATYSFVAAHFPRKESTFTLFGIYIIVSSFLALFSIDEGYFWPYVYWYMVVMAIGTILMVYPSFHAYKPGGNKCLHLLWPIVLFGVLFVSGMQFAILGHFSPMLCTLCTSNLAIAAVFMPFQIVCVLLLLTCYGYQLLPVTVPIWSTVWASWETATQPAAYAVAMVGIILITQLYRYMRDRAIAKQNVIALARTYERSASLQAIYNQKNWSRLDPTHGGAMLQKMSQLLGAPCQYLYAHGQEQLGASINNFTKKLHAFGKLLLQKAKEERSLTIDPNVLQSVRVEAVIAQAHQNVRDLEVPIQLLLRNQSEVQELLADPALLERLLTINFLETSNRAQDKECMITCAITDTLLHYDCEQTIQIEKETLTLPALAFCIRTDTLVQEIKPFYDATDTVSTSCLPKTEEQLYQAESRQIVEAHGGYVEILETSEVLSCLYVLPIAGKQVMCFKTHDPNAFEPRVAETTESIQQEKELVELLVTQTMLQKDIVEKTIVFTKNAYNNMLRPSGEPYYYTYPMEVTRLLLDMTKDPDALLAGLLHDLVENTSVRVSQIELLYGSAVAHIVDMVTYYKTNGYRWKLEAEANKSMLEACNDIRIVYITLADRLYNLRTLHAHQWEDQQRIAKDTLEFYIPWGRKHKVAQWLEEMRQICEQILDNRSQ